MAYIGRDIEYGVLEKQTLTADSSTVAFDLTYISDANGLIVSVGGIVQEPNVAYTVLGSTLTFTEAPTTGDTVFVVYLGQEMTVSSVIPQDAIDYQVMTGNGSNTLVLNHSVTNAEDLLVTYNGVNQKPGTDYTVSGTTLTFTTTPPTGMKVLVYFMALAGNTLWDGSVTNPKIVSMDASKLTGSMPSSVSEGSFAAQYQDLSTLALHWASVDNKVAMNLTDDFIDHFQDSTGVDSTNSVNALVSSDEYVTSASELDTATNIAPSSNDWDYTFASNHWTATGNSLGDHSVGGYVDGQGNSGLSSLTTLDGDFVIKWTSDNDEGVTFGVASITDDGSRSQSDGIGMHSSGIESYYYREAGGNINKFWIGNSVESGNAYIFADGSEIVMRRVSGTITIEDDGVVVHTFSSTNSNPVRFFISNNQTAKVDISDLTIEDTSKIQRDGMFDENQATSRSFGHGPALDNMGTRFIATRSGSVTSVKCNVHSVSTGFTAHAEMWLGTSTSPTSQVGSDSNTQSFSSTGDKTFTFTDVTLQKGQVYWLICVAPNTGTGDVSMKGHTAPIGDGAFEIVTGRHSTITSITDNIPQVMAMEVVVDTSAGEPTPDHDTLLLIQSDTTNGSTSFVDSSQNGYTLTPNSVSHSTAKKKFGASSLKFTGNGTNSALSDVSIPHDDAFDFPGDFTIDFWFNTVSSDHTGNGGTMIGRHHAAAGKTSQIGFRDSSNGQLMIQVSTQGPRNENFGPTGLNDGNWHHVAWVRNGTGTNNCKIYVDGSQEHQYSSNDVWWSTTAVSPIYIGSYPPFESFGGYMDEIRFSNVARWDADFTPPTAAYGTSTNTTLSATGSLVSTSSTADSAVSEVTGALLVKDSVGTNTIGTDLKAYFSSDNGSNWTEAESYDSSFTFDGTTKVIPLGATTLSNTGTAVKMKAEWANQVATLPATGTTKVISPIGDANFSSSQVKIGNSSLYCDGTGDLISVADSDDFAFTGDYTVEFWSYFVGTPPNGAHCWGQGGNTAGNFAFMCRSEGGGTFIFGTSNGSTQRLINPGIDLSDAWHHIAMVKSGTSQKLYIDGTQRGSVLTHSEPVQNVSAPWEFGGNSNQSSYIEAYFDEIRFSDVARYTADFTPDTTAFTTDANTKLLIHGDSSNPRTQVGQGVGNAIGTAITNGGLSAAFDGTLHNTYQTTAGLSGGGISEISVGKDWGTDYSNNCGTGDRRSIITVTTDLNIQSGVVTSLVDGAIGTSNGWYPVASQNAAGKYIRFQLSYAKAFNDVTFRTAAADGGLGIWKFQGSNDGTTWTDLSGNVTLGNAITESFSLNNTTAYTYYQAVGVSGTPIDNWIYEFEFGEYTGVTKTISGFKVYSTSNDGLSSSTAAGSANCSLTLLGSNTNNIATATELGSLTDLNFIQNNHEYSKLSGITTTTAYRYHWIKGAQVNGTSGSMYLSEVQFFEGDSITDSSYAPEVIGKIAQLHGWAVNY